MGLEDLEVSMNFPLDISGRSNDNKLPDIHSINHDYVSHAFQKVSTTQANHALFWVQDSDNNSVLAIVVRVFSLEILPNFSSKSN